MKVSTSSNSFVIAKSSAAKLKMRTLSPIISVTPLQIPNMDVESEIPYESMWRFPWLHWSSSSSRDWSYLSERTCARDQIWRFQERDVFQFRHRRRLSRSRDTSVWLDWSHLKIDTRFFTIVERLKILDAEIEDLLKSFRKWSFSSVSWCAEIISFVKSERRWFSFFPASCPMTWSVVRSRAIRISSKIRDFHNKRKKLTTHLGKWTNRALIDFSIYELVTTSVNCKTLSSLEVPSPFRWRITFAVADTYDELRDDFFWMISMDTFMQICYRKMYRSNFNFFP